jgi:hypothetical protein
MVSPYCNQENRKPWSCPLTTAIRARSGVRLCLAHIAYCFDSWFCNSLAEYPGLRTIFERQGHSSILVANVHFDLALKGCSPSASCPSILHCPRHLRRLIRGSHPGHHWQSAVVPDGMSVHHAPSILLQLQLLTVPQHGYVGSSSGQIRRGFSMDDSTGWHTQRWTDYFSL